MVNGIRSELLKMKRTPILWVHIVLPLLGVLLFSLYYSRMQIWNPNTKASAYLQSVGVVYPTVIAAVCAGAVQLEGSAGIQRMFCTGRRKETGLLYKCAALLLLALMSTAVSALGFGAVFGGILAQDELGFLFYIKVTAVIFASVLILYLFHLFLSLRFSKTASIGVGIAESLVSALMLTGLGDGIWQFIPCSYAARIPEGVLRLTVSSAEDAVIQKLILNETLKGFAVMAVFTGLFFLCFLLWYQRFEKSEADF